MLFGNRISPFAHAGAVRSRLTSTAAERPAIRRYAPDAGAAWRPRGESPLLAELVCEGRLPPLAQRTGSEPVVMQGVDGIGRYGGTWQRLVNSITDFTTIYVEFNETYGTSKYDHVEPDDAFHACNYAYMAGLQYAGRLIPPDLPPSDKLDPSGFGY